MEEYQLALIYPLDQEIEAEFEALSHEFRSLFIGDKKYLLDISYEGRHCLAKRLGVLIDYDSLSLLQMNFISLLKKLFPERHFSTRSIFLVPEKNQGNRIIYK